MMSRSKKIHFGVRRWLATTFRAGADPASARSEFIWRSRPPKQFQSRRGRLGCSALSPVASEQRHRTNCRPDRVRIARQQQHDRVQWSRRKVKIKSPGNPGLLFDSPDFTRFYRWPPLPPPPPPPPPPRPPPPPPPPLKLRPPRPPPPLKLRPPPPPPPLKLRPPPPPPATIARAAATPNPTEAASAPAPAEAATSAAATVKLRLPPPPWRYITPPRPPPP